MKTNLILFSSCLFLFTACGDDDGGGGDPLDAPTGGGPDAAGPTADAPPGIDAGPTADAREDFTGLDEPCCDPTGTCDNEMVCLEGLAIKTCSPDPEVDAGAAADAGMGGICRPRCTPGVTGECPFPSACRMFSGGYGVCLPAVGDDEPCSPDRCDDAYVCVGLPPPDNAMHFCREICTGPADCETDETCTMVSSGIMACLPN